MMDSRIDPIHKLKVNTKENLRNLIRDKQKLSLMTSTIEQRNLQNKID